MKSLKLADADLHRRLKKVCVDNDLSMIDAVHQMVKAWVLDAEARRRDLDLKSLAIAKAATRRHVGKPNRPQEPDAT